MVTKPAEGMAAAPIAARVAVQATTTVPASPNATPCACKTDQLLSLPTTAWDMIMQTFHSSVRLSSNSEDFSFSILCSLACLMTKVGICLKVET